MNQEHTNALPFGTTIDSYQIKDVLGVGGFGITYRAYDYTLDQTVAIKEYLPDGLAYRVPDSQALTHRSQGDVETYQYGLTRFLDEARTLARFRDPSIVRVIRFIEANGTAYLVMDYEHGDLLAHRLRRGTLPDNQIRQLLLKLLHGLSAVHAQDYLHRDIKPANILLRTEGVPVLLDFGAARQALGEQTKMLTAMVTPGYAPFEQYHTKDAQGPWSDLYALGATLYHCMTGRAPPAATERVAALYDGSQDPAEKRLETVEDRYSRELIDLVSWLLKPHAKDRPQTTTDVLGQVQPVDFDVGAELEPRRPNSDAQGEPDSRIEPEVLKTVHVNLEEQIGPMAAALVRKAGRQASNVEELTELLARFIPSDEQKTQFLGRTRMIKPEQVQELVERTKATPPRRARQQPQPAETPEPRRPRPSGEPQARPAQQPKARSAEQPQARPAQQPKAPPDQQPRARPAQQPKARPHQHPQARPAQQPKARPVQQPKARPAQQPKARPAQQPKARPAQQPQARPAQQPKARPAQQQKARPVDRPAQPPEPPPSLPGSADVPDAPAAAAISEHLIQVAKEQLVVYVGPIAGMLVRKSAKRASSTEDFVRRLSEELGDARQRAEFLRSMKAVQPRGR